MPRRKSPAGPRRGATVPSNANTILEKIFDLRSRQIYQDAEATRQSTGALPMATSPDPTLNGQVRLLIATWEEIARIVRTANSEEALETIFENIPIGFMWDALELAISYIRRTTPGYANGFGKLAKAYAGWLKKKSPRYRTAAKSGLNAMFG